MELMAGGGSVEGAAATKPPVTTDCLASGLTTLTSFGPTAMVGVTTVIEVAVGVPEMVPALAPKNTWLPAWKPVPVIWTVVPPTAGPVAGLMPVMTGAGAVEGGGPPGRAKKAIGNID